MRRPNGPMGALSSTPTSRTPGNMTWPKLVSINVLATNERDCLRRCLECIQHQTYSPIEVIVIDNASSDGTDEMLKSAFPEFPVITNPENLGYCKSHNIGIRQCRGDYVMPLNADVFMEPGFVEAKVRAIESAANIGMVEGKLLRIAAHDAEIPDEKIIDGVGAVLTRARRNFERGQLEPDRGQYDEHEFIFGASGAAPLYRREMLNDIAIEGEFFDEDFFIYRDEVDLAWRAQWQGWKCLYTPDAVAYHVRGYAPDKRKKISRRFRQLQLRNRYLMIAKNFALPNIMRDLHHILWFEFRQWAYVPLFEPHLFLGLFGAIKLMPKMRSKRKAIVARRRESARYIHSLLT